MTVKDLKELLAKLPDDAEVLARSRDCISLQCVDIVGCMPRLAPDGPDGHTIETVYGNTDLTYHETFDTVYGGGDDDDPPKAAIICCECT